MVGGNIAATAILSVALVYLGRTPKHTAKAWEQNW